MKTIKQIFIVTGLALTLQACSSDSNPAVSAPPPPPPPPPPAMASFDVTVSNLTNAQPLSPIAVIAHRDAYSIFTIGLAASAALERLAEDGNNGEVITEADGDTANVFVTGSGAAPIGPAGSETVAITMLESDLAELQLSVATMLVNTNDAISALNSLDASTMAVGDVIQVNVIAYDAGTEADTEAAGDIPGPAGGGEGFNAARSDDNDRVAMHAGVVSQDDGFVTSDLTQQHRFDNPVMRVRLERTQ